MCRLAVAVELRAVQAARQEPVTPSTIALATGCDQMPRTTVELVLGQIQFSAELGLGSCTSVVVLHGHCVQKGCMAPAESSVFDHVRRARGWKLFLMFPPHDVERQIEEEVRIIL